MKIRTGFVTNSSSTSFVIIGKDELTEAKFFELMGIEKTSPFIDVFQFLYDSLDLNNSLIENNAPLSDYITLVEKSFIPKVRERIERARKEGKKIYIGELSSDNNTIESFFCTESFEVDSEDFYFSAINAAW